MDTIQTTVFAQSLSNFTCELWMMRRGTLFNLGHRVSGQGREEEPYSFWVTGSVVKVNFGTLRIRPCGHDTDYVTLRYCFTPYQRLLLYNGAPLVGFYDTLGIRRTYSRLKPRRPKGGGGRGYRLQLMSNHLQTLHVGFG